MFDAETPIPVTRRRALKTVGAAALLGVFPSSALARKRRVCFDPAAIGVCSGPGDAQTAHDSGAAYLEIGCGELRADQPDDAVTDQLERLRALPLPARCANGFLPGMFQATGPDADHDAIIEYATTIFRRASSVGIETITFGSSGARTVPGGFDHAEADLQFTSLLARFAGPAQAAGVLVCVEPLRQAETNYINRVAHAARLVRAVDHPSLAITADLYHMLVEDEGPEPIENAGGLIRHVHVAEEEGRRPPGTTNADFTPYLRALQRVGYEGRISIECRWTDLGGELPRAVGAVREQLARL